MKNIFENLMEILECETMTEVYMTVGIIGGFAIFTFIQAINMLTWIF